VFGHPSMGRYVDGWQVDLLVGKSEQCYLQIARAYFACNSHLPACYHIHVILLVSVWLLFSCVVVFDSVDTVRRKFLSRVFALTNWTFVFCCFLCDEHCVSVR